MKRLAVLGMGVCIALAFSSCKSSESAYKKAYEKAKAQETAQVQPETTETNTNVVAPVVEAPVTEVRIVDNSDNVEVKTESVSLVNGSGLKNYSVVVGSFSVMANAEGLQQRLKGEGYDAQLVKNTDRNMYRVIATTFDSKVDAASSRNDLRTKFPDAWLLYNGR